MKITIIGSTQYRDMFETHRRKLTEEGHEVRIPAFDDHPELDELGICFFNKEIILWCDEVHMIWDRRSVGAIFDFGMLFMAGKPLRIIYFEPKTFEGVMRKYEARFKK